MVSLRRVELDSWVRSLGAGEDDEAVRALTGLCALLVEAAATTAQVRERLTDAPHDGIGDHLHQAGRHLADAVAGLDELASALATHERDLPAVSLPAEDRTRPVSAIPLSSRPRCSVG